jgi:hypothetical protein
VAPVRSPLMIMSRTFDSRRPSAAAASLALRQLTPATGLLSGLIL